MSPPSLYEARRVRMVADKRMVRSMRRSWWTALIVAVMAVSAPGHAGLIGSMAKGPMVEVMPSTGKPRGTVLFISGDAGWARSTGRASVGPLRAAGLVVVGLDTLQFFDAARTPAEVAGWLAAAATAPGVPATGPMILMGQSFGADALPAAVPLLPPALIARVAGVGLLVPGLERFDAISLGEFLGTSHGVDNRLAATALARRFPVLCVQGKDETDSLCPTLSGREVQTVRLPGGHMLGRDSDAIGRVLADWAVRLLGRA